MTSKYDRFIYLLNKEFRTGQMLSKETPKNLYDDDTFRRWKHEVSELFRKINNNGYSEKCGIDERDFGESPKCKNQKAIFARDVNDTLTEMDTVLREAKFHTPEPRITTDKKLTLKWLFDHGSLPFWSQIIGISISIFIFGFSMGVKFADTQLYKYLTTNSNTETIKITQPKK